MTVQELKKKLAEFRDGCEIMLEVGGDGAIHQTTTFAVTGSMWNDDIVLLTSEKLMFSIGDKVRVKRPTGGVRRDDVFEVVPAPEHGDSQFVWVKATMADDPMRPFIRWSKEHRPMGFVEESLELAS